MVGWYSLIFWDAETHHQPGLEFQFQCHGDIVRSSGPTWPSVENSKLGFLTDVRRQSLSTIETSDVHVWQRPRWPIPLFTGFFSRGYQAQSHSHVCGPATCNYTHLTSAVVILKVPPWVLYYWTNGIENYWTNDRQMREPQTPPSMSIAWTKGGIHTTRVQLWRYHVCVLYLRCSFTSLLFKNQCGSTIRGVTTQWFWLILWLTMLASHNETIEISLFAWTNVEYQQ